MGYWQLLPDDPSDYYQHSQAHRMRLWASTSGSTKLSTKSTQYEIVVHEYVHYDNRKPSSSDTKDLARCITSGRAPLSWPNGNPAISGISSVYRG